MSEHLHIKTSRYESPHYPQAQWYWVITDGDGEVVDYRYGFESNDAAVSNAERALKNIIADPKLGAPR